MSFVMSKRGKYNLRPADWVALVAAGDVRLLLFHETSTAAPTVDDEFVADLIPASNELVNDDYDRIVLEDGSVVWGDDDRWQLFANDVETASMSAEHGGQGVKGYALYVHVTDDTDSWLIGSEETAITLLWGGPLTIQWPTDGIVGV